MRNPVKADTRSAQTGGITILVALMMLVLLTLAAVGLSRNSFREVVTSGFSRQGAMARNVADSGLEWCLYWFNPNNLPTATGNAANLVAEKTTVDKNPLLAGVSKDIISGANYTPGGTLQAGMELPAPTGVTQGYTMGITFMGNPDIAWQSNGAGQGAYAPAAPTPASAISPAMWAVRADAQVIQGGVTFIHGREAWITVPSTQN
jgi:hypothetical protein